MHAIEIKNVSKKFKERGKVIWALKDVDMNIERGEIFGLLGPNGAGKSTLLNILIRLLTPDSGSVKIFGKEINKNPEVLEQTNFASGESKFHWRLRCKDILRYYGKSYNIRKKVLEKRIVELTKFFGIDHLINRDFDVLSTGERMRLIFVKALLNKPKLLLLDEPTLGLDPSMAIRLREEIKRVNKTFGTTILLTSHYMHEVEQLSDRIAFISMGKIVDIGTVEKVKLKKFKTYDLIIKLEDTGDKKFLRRLGFRVTGNKITKTLSHDENLSNVIFALSKYGYKVLDVETKRPSLEDYFVKILKVKK